MQIQLQLPGMEQCKYQCLTDCPMAPLGKDCLWDDPGIGMFDLVEYPEFFFWRIDHGMGEHAVRPREGNSCPRCYSIEIVMDYPDIRCLNCGYNEPLIDFPISHYYHLALEKMFNLEI